SLRVIMAYGKFHGVIRRHGPTGCLVVTIQYSPLGEGSNSPRCAIMSSEYHRRKLVPYLASAKPSLSGFPVSREIRAPISSIRSVATSWSLRNASERLSEFAVDQLAKAMTEAFRASSQSPG